MLILKKKKYRTLGIKISKQYNCLFLKSILGVYILKFTKTFYLKKDKIFFVKDKKSLKKILLNIFKGLNYGWYINILVNGRGYFFLSNKKFLKLNLGFSHGIGLKIPKNILIYCEKKKKNYLYLFGVSLIDLYNLAFCIKNLRKVDDYKGRGIRYSFDKLLLKSINKK